MTDKARLTELAKALRAFGDDTTLGQTERVLCWDASDALRALLEKNAHLADALLKLYRAVIGPWSEDVKWTVVEALDAACLVLEEQESEQ